MERDLAKTPYLVHGCRSESENCDSSKKRASQKEQNDTNSSFVAPSSEELRVRKVLVKTPDYSPWFLAKKQ